MNKKYFHLSLFVTLLFFLLAGFSGCDNLTSIFTKNSKSKAYISLNVASVSNGESITYFDSESRTALPTFTRESIKSFKFSLLYTTAATPPESGWDSLISFEEEGDSADNLAAMEQASIPIAPGTYYFKISANKGGTCLEGISERMTIGGGNNPISINLVWDDNHLPEADPGSLTFTLDFSKASNADDVAYATTELQGDTSTGEVEADITGNKVVLTASDLKAGNYQMIIRLYGDTEKKNLITVWPESAIITGGQESSGSHELTSLNELYTITWHNHDITGVSCSETFPQKYTRFTAEYTFPIATEISRTGYDFEGWFTDEECTQSAGTKISQGSTGPKDFYAKWTARTDTPYVVKHWKQKLNADTTQNDTNYELDDTQNLTGTTDSKIATLEIKDTSSGSYYGFETPTSSEITAAQALTVLPDGTLVVNLYYKRYQTRCIYEDNVSNAEITVPERFVCHYGQTITISDEEPSRTGYTFEGWTLVAEPTDSDTVYKKGTANTTVTVELSQIIFYAKWAPIPYTVTFVMDGGSEIAAQTVFFDQCATEPATPPTKNKCMFDGWFADSQFKNVFDFTKPISGNTPIYAKWNLAYAKINDTYYADLSSTELAIDKLKQQPEYQNGEDILMTITLYSPVRAAELGKGIYNGNNGGTGIIGMLKQNPYFVTFIIDEEANIRIEDDQCELLFGGCEKFTSIDISGLNTSAITTMNGMFQACYGLTSLTFGDHFNTTSLMHLSDTFTSCTSLESIDLSCFSTTNLVTMEGTFKGCTNLKVVDLSSFNTSKVTNMKNLFYQDGNLETIYASASFVTTSVQTDYSEDLFTHCDKLTGQKGSTVNAVGITGIAAAKIDQGTTAPGYFSRKPYPVGSIVLKTGDIIPYSENLELTSEQKQSAIAVVIYDGKATDALGEKLLGVGLEMTKAKIAIEKDPNNSSISVKGFMTILDSSDDDGKVFTQAIQNCEDYADHAQEYYPACYWVSNYKDAVNNIDATPYENGWYIPAKNELKCIYDNVAIINSAFLKINENALVFDNTEGDSPTGYYWAAWQHQSYYTSVGYMKFWMPEGSEFDTFDKDNSKPFATAIHEF